MWFAFTHLMSCRKGRSLKDLSSCFHRVILPRCLHVVLWFLFLRPSLSFYLDMDLFYTLRYAGKITIWNMFYHIFTCSYSASPSLSCPMVFFYLSMIWHSLRFGFVFTPNVVQEGLQIEILVMYLQPLIFPLRICQVHLCFFAWPSLSFYFHVALFSHLISCRRSRGLTCYNVIWTSDATSTVSTSTVILLSAHHYFIFH